MRPAFFISDVKKSEFVKCYFPKLGYFSLQATLSIMLLRSETKIDEIPLYSSLCAAEQDSLYLCLCIFIASA